MTTARNSRQWKISSGRHFQNGHHNTAQIQHFPISMTFHMWVDYVVPNWFLKSKNFYGTSLSTHISNFDDIGQFWIFAVLWRPFWKWRPVEIFQCQESIQDIIIYLHMKCHWNRKMLNLCGIVATILKMATGRNFSKSICHNAKCSFKPVVSGRFGRLHNR
jgi:hypothetical protein